MEVKLTAENIGSYDFRDATFKFSVETQEEFVAQRTNKLFATVELSAEIIAENSKFILQIMEWALETKGQQHKNLEFEIYHDSSDKKVSRYYVFPDAFIIDYFETLDGETGELMFTLKVGQRQVDLKNIKVKELG